MENNIDFKNLWKQQNVNQPNMEELQAKLKQFRKSNIQKLIFVNIILIILSAIIIAKWYYYQPDYLSTKIGIILTILAMFIFVLSNNKLFELFSSLDNTQTNSGFIQSLSIIKTKQNYLQTSILSLYFILLSLGICLYMYEYTLKMTTFWSCFSYAGLLIWIAFNWFYLRPKAIKKQNLKLDRLIDKCEIIRKQLAENE